jgi:hypothetical protein
MRPISSLKFIFIVCVKASLAAADEAAVAALLFSMGATQDLGPGTLQSASYKVIGIVTIAADQSQ